MDIICPQCNTTYRFAESRIPDRKASFACKRCGKRLTIAPPARPREKQVQTAPQTRQTPIVSHAAQGQYNAIAFELPESTGFAPQHYALDQLLQPNKKGRYKTRLNKLKIKLLGAVQAPLDALLEDDEQVLHVAAATAFYPVELFFGNGWLTMLYNRYVLVGTNRRLVAVNTNHKMTRPTHYLFQFPYHTIKKISRGLLGTSLVLTRKKGKRRSFNGIKRALAAEMKKLISANIDPSFSIDTASFPPENLCPACYKALPPKISSCPKCRAQFKNPRKAALRSLLLPGWGDIYLGHRFLGGLELLCALLVWLFAANLLLSNDPVGLGIAITLLLIYNGFDSLLTLHMAKKGHSLEKKQPQSAAMRGLSTSRA
jgi:predicted amidophosphoribosyltransferase